MAWLTLGFASVFATWMLETLVACFSTSDATLEMGLFTTPLGVSFLLEPGLLLVLLGTVFDTFCCLARTLFALFLGFRSRFGSKLALLSDLSLFAEETPLELLVRLPVTTGVGLSLFLNSLSLSNIEFLLCGGA